LDEHRAIQRLEELVLSGFVGVRFNPYLFPKSQEPVPQSTTNNDAIVASRSEWGPMSEGTSLQVYQRCASLHIPVGIMCFQGLQYHYHDIQQLLESSPQTIMILDHFAFTQLDDDTVDASSPNQNTFVQLLQLATYPSVHVKISALFRMNDNRSSSTTGPYERVYRERFVPLLQAYGPQRLLYGSDFPYVLESESRQNDTDHAYTNTCQLVASWCPDVESRNAIMGGNAERLFGPWGTLVPATR
jgi:predicted TIM-barrel fold metal-dependent hydrolase